VAIPPSRLQHVLKAAAETGCDLAIIDAPPFAKDIAFEAAQHADFILVPTRPAVLDVMAITKTLELLGHYNKPSAVVLTFCPVLGREVADTEGAVKQLGADLAPIRIQFPRPAPGSRPRNSKLTAKPPRKLDNYTRMRVYPCSQIELRSPMSTQPNSLQAVLDRQAKPAAPAAPRQRLPKLDQESNRAKFYRPSREGQRLIAGHFDPKIAKQLRMLAVEEDTTVQVLLEEALNLLFLKKGQGAMRRKKQEP
jgi:hypothetical protein